MNDGLHSGRPRGEPGLSASERSTLSLSPLTSGPGKLIAGRYRVETLIGEGGFGRVYRAFDQKLERTVALKRLSLLQDQPARGDKVRRFEEEVRVLARLDHPSIVPLYDAGVEDEAPWMTMRLVAGHSLEDILRDGGPLPPSQALPLLIPIARALSHAHRHGIIHRDVKPANILVEKRDSGPHAWLTDFGIAKILTGLHLTREGVVLGTPRYMSPEQATGRTVDAPTDVFSFGCVAVELLTGQPAFPGSSAVEVFHAILHKSPDLSELRERAGSGFEAAILRCLAKSPEDRWQTFDDLLPELETLSTKPLASGFPSTLPRTPRRNWWLGLATGVLAAALIGTWIGRPAQTRESRIADSTTPARHLLRGEILDAETRMPLSRVLVYLPELDLRSTTDEQGQYSFEVPLPSGTQVKLRATREGYQPVNADPPVGSEHLNTYRMWRGQ